MFLGDQIKLLLMIAAAALRAVWPHILALAVVTMLVIILTWATHGGQS